MSDLNASETIQAIRLSAEGFKIFCKQEGLDPSCPKSAHAHYTSTEHYEIRWSIDSLLHHDDADSLLDCLEQGFPIEATVGFAHGNLACSACLIGAPRCLELLAIKGADLGFVNNRGDMPLTLAFAQSFEYEDGLACAEFLFKHGTPATQAARMERAGSLNPNSTGLKTHPLGRLFLNQARHDYHDALFWALHRGSSEQALLSSISNRLARLHRSSLMNFKEFYGHESLSTLLDWANSTQIPAAIAIHAWGAQQSFIEAQTLCDAIAIPQPKPLQAFGLGRI